MSEPVIYIGVIHSEDFLSGHTGVAARSETFGSVEKVIEYLEQLKQKGNKSPEDLESCFVG